MVQRAKLQLHTRAESAVRGAVREPSQATARAKAREGTRLVGAHVPIATWRELHALRGELGLTMQALVVEALEDLVAKHRGR
jgi:hypothetical protein